MVEPFPRTLSSRTHLAAHKALSAVNGIEWYITGGCTKINDVHLFPGQISPPLVGSGPVERGAKSN